MKSRLFLTATAGFMLLGTSLVFAQSYSDQGTTTLRPGQAPTVVPSDQAPSYTTTPDVGIVTLKPGQTDSTSLPQDYGSVQAGATAFGPNTTATVRSNQGG